MSNGMKIHGGVDFKGGDSDAKEFSLEKLDGNPDNPKSRRVWFNQEQLRVAYSESTTEDLDTITRYLATLDDIELLTQLVAAKADRISDTSHVTINNISTDDMKLGQPVYGASHLDTLLACANDEKKDVIGLVSDNLILSNNGSGKALTSGILTGTVSQWEFATGMVGGLVSNQKYFLDTVAGRLTLAPPSEPGQYICQLGMALSPTVFLIRIERPIAI